MNEPILIERDDDVATVTLNRPERRNSLDAEGASGVAAAVAEAAADARVVILTGAGKSFCAGGDLDELARWNSMDSSVIGSILYESFQSMIRAIRSVDAIVIAAVNGAAVGAGMDLALACDLRVASTDARFGQVWVRLGVIPGTGGAYLTQALAGPGKAAELLLTGDIISAEAALAAGLVNEVVPADALLGSARAWADRILVHPRDGVIANKRAYISATEAAVDAALAHAAQVQPGRFTSQEFREALNRARSRPT